MFQWTMTCTFLRTKMFHPLWHELNLVWQKMERLLIHFLFLDFDFDFESELKIFKLILILSQCLQASFVFFCFVRLNENFDHFTCYLETWFYFIPSQKKQENYE